MRTTHNVLECADCLEAAKLLEQFNWRARQLFEDCPGYTHHTYPLGFAVVNGCEANSRSDEAVV